MYPDELKFWRKHYSGQPLNYFHLWHPCIVWGQKAFVMHFSPRIDRAFPSINVTGMGCATTYEEIGQLLGGN